MMGYVFAGLLIFVVIPSLFTSIIDFLKIILTYFVVFLALGTYCRGEHADENLFTGLVVFTIIYYFMLPLLFVLIWAKYGSKDEE